MHPSGDSSASQAPRSATPAVSIFAYRGDWTVVRWRARRTREETFRLPHGDADGPSSKFGAAHTTGTCLAPTRARRNSRHEEMAIRSRVHAHGRLGGGLIRARLDTLRFEHRRRHGGAFRGRPSSERPLPGPRAPRSARALGAGDGGALTVDRAEAQVRSPRDLRPRTSGISSTNPTPSTGTIRSTW